MRYPPGTRATGICATCGATFVMLPHLQGRRRYCSLSCSTIASNAPRRSCFERACEQCGGPFIAKPSHVARGDARFCSRACHTAFRLIEWRQSLEPRFWSKVDKTETCWLWLAARLDGGYGVTRATIVGVKYEKSHRVAWVLASGAPIPEGLEVCHVCDVRHCCRNDEPGTYLVNGKLLPRFGHLFLGTAADNAADKMAKGRHGHG